MRVKTALAALSLTAVLVSSALAATPAEQAAGISPGADPARLGAPAGTASGELATLTGSITKDELGYRLATEEGRSYVLDVSDAQRNLDDLVGASVRLTGMLVADEPAMSSGTTAPAPSGASAEAVGIIRVKDVEPVERKAEER